MERKWQLVEQPEKEIEEEIFSIVIVTIKKILGEMLTYFIFSSYI